MVLAHDVPDVDTVPVVVNAAVTHVVSHEPVILYSLVASQDKTFFKREKYKYLCAKIQEKK